MTHAFAHTRQSLPNGGSFFSLPLLAAELPNVARMPVSLRIVLESVLRNCDGKKVTPEHVRALAAWKPNERRTEEIPFVVARVILPNVLLAVLSGAFLTFAIVIGEFTFSALLDRPAFGPFLQRLGQDRAYEPAALSVIAFAITWACMGLIQLVTRLQRFRAP